MNTKRRGRGFIGSERSPKEREECCEVVRLRTILKWFRNIDSETHDRSKSRTPLGPSKNWGKLN